jgi:N-hydroxyarylamine O-acetyltransferase
MRDVPLSLEADALFEKIVIRQRGGYCFELNALFAWLLKMIGFKVKDYFARFLRDEPTIPMRRHRVMRVSCGSEDYLCDVGVGGTIPRRPVPVYCGTPCVQGDETYKLEREPFLGYVLYELKKDGWRRLYSFTEEEQLETDFAATSFYCERHPDSFFRTRDMVHIFTEDGRKSIAGREFKIFAPEGVRVTNVTTEDEYRDILARHFGITQFLPPNTCQNPATINMAARI